MVEPNGFHRGCTKGFDNLGAIEQFIIDSYDMLEDWKIVQQYTGLSSYERITDLNISMRNESF